MYRPRIRIRGGLLTLPGESEMLLRKKDVINELGLSTSTIYRQIHCGLFPKPIKVGKRAVGWPIQEINKLKSALIAGLADKDIRNLIADIHNERNSNFNRIALNPKQIEGSTDE